MAKLIFDIGDDFLTINGELYKGEFLTTARNQVLAINFMPSNGGYIPLLSKLTIMDNNIVPTKNIIVTDCQNGIFAINFAVQSYLSFLPAQPYFQMSLSTSDNLHYLTAYKQGVWKCSLETQTEIITFDTFDELQNISCKYSRINGGDLITIQGTFDENFRFLKILFYDNDYLDILELKCQNINFLDDGLEIVDLIDDIPNRIITRKLSFTDGQYIERKRTFEYRHDGKIIDELLPVAFAEGVFCKDFEFCRELISSNSKNLNYLDILGDFDEIFLPNYIDIPPLRLGLAYYHENGKSIKYFEFGVKNNKIFSIIPCKNFL